MSPLTLPGRPGLLRHCSPVLAPVSKRVRAIGRRAIVIGEHLDSGGVLLADGAIEAYEDLALDLTDPTGRAHAAWWVIAKCDPSTLSVDASVVVLLGATGEDMTPEQINRLRLVCLHVAGLAP